MKVKKVNQYQCEHCGKKNYSAGHMRTHEAHCTMNPERACRMCERAGEAPTPIKELLAMLPEPHIGEGFHYPLINIEEIDRAIETVHEKTECPACTLAAIRQKGIMVPMTKFNYRAACNDFWAEWQEDEIRSTGMHGFI